MLWRVLGTLSREVRRFAVRSRAAWLTVLAVGIAACNLTGPTQASLSEEQVAKLQFEGSVELISTGGHDAEQTPEGPLPAIAWREYGADVAWDELVAFFDDTLRDRGWEQGGGSSGLRSTQEFDVVAWHNGDRILRLAHRRNSMAADVPRSFGTIYRVTLIGERVPSD